MLEGTGFDNFNPMIWRFGEADKDSGMYMAVTDTPGGMRFNISDLSTMGKKIFISIKIYSFDYDLFLYTRNL